MRISIGGGWCDQTAQSSHAPCRPCNLTLSTWTYFAVTFKVPWEEGGHNQTSKFVTFLNELYKFSSNCTIAHVTYSGTLYTTINKLLCNIGNLIIISRPM